MTQRTLAIIITLSLGLFMAFLAGGTWLKRPLGHDDDVEAILARLDIVRASADADWEQAEMLVERLETAWQKVQRRIQYSVQMDDLLLFADELQRLKAAVETRSGPLAWQSVRLMQAIWHRM